MVKVKKVLTLIITLIILTSYMLFSLVLNVSATNEELFSSDGTYEVSINYDLKMGANNFSNPIMVEKENGNYYLTIGYSSSIGYLNLNLEEKEVGKTSEKKVGWTYYTYTLSESNLKSKLSFSAYINAMSREMSFTATLDFSTVNKTKETIRNLGERPAEFIPVITINAALEYSLQIGTTFSIPLATAKLGNEECLVDVLAYFNDQQIDIFENKLTIDNVGTYKLVYKASNSKYKTSLGNDSFSLYVVTISSSLGENELVKFKDINNILVKSSKIMAGKLTSGSLFYDKAKISMKKIADNFEVYSVEFLNETGEKIVLKDNVELLFRADDYYDRSKVVVYYMNELSELTKLPTNGYGRYVSVQTRETGIFIVCIPGTTFHMPIYGYILIICGILALIVGITVIIIVLRKRQKKVNI